MKWDDIIKSDFNLDDLPHVEELRDCWNRWNMSLIEAFAAMATTEAEMFAEFAEDEDIGEENRREFADAGRQLAEHALVNILQMQGETFESTIYLNEKMQFRGFTTMDFIHDWFSNKSDYMKECLEDIDKLQDPYQRRKNQEVFMRLGEAVAPRALQLAEIGESFKDCIAAYVEVDVDDSFDEDFRGDYA